MLRLNTVLAADAVEWSPASVDGSAEQMRPEVHKRTGDGANGYGQHQGNEDDALNIHHGCVTRCAGRCSQQNQRGFALGGRAKPNSPQAEQPGCSQR